MPDEDEVRLVAEEGGDGYLEHGYRPGKGAAQGCKTKHGTQPVNAKRQAGCERSSQEEREGISRWRRTRTRPGL